MPKFNSSAVRFNKSSVRGNSPPANVVAARSACVATRSSIALATIVVAIIQLAPVAVNNVTAKGKKKQKYAQMRIAYYVIYDPEQQLSKQTLRIYELHGTEYVLRKDHWVPGIGLGLVLWHGVYEEHEDTWLRWCDKDGNLLLSGKERAEQERQRAEQERQRADSERNRADHYAALLKAAGLLPPQ